MKLSIDELSSLNKMIKDEHEIATFMHFVNNTETPLVKFKGNAETGYNNHLIHMNSSICQMVLIEASEKRKVLQSNISKFADIKFRDESVTYQR